MWIECNTGGGEEINGIKIKKGGPPTLFHPASQQGGGEEDNILAGGAWRGLEERWGSMGKIFGLSFHFQTRNLFSITWELGSGWACLDRSLADLVNERRQLE